MKILICGDSFAADWTVKYKGQGWPNMLSKIHTVNNLAQAGCSEYKILKQIYSVNLNLYDKIIISHTSPYRIYINQHPVHYKDPLHKNCDLIYLDLLEHSKSDDKVIPIIDYFENYFDLEYAVFVHNLICEKIEYHTNAFSKKVLHITSHNWDNLYNFDNMINFNYLNQNYKGLLNHFNDIGNEIIFNKINELILIKK